MKGQRWKYIVSLGLTRAPSFVRLVQIMIAYRANAARQVGQWRLEALMQCSKICRASQMWMSSDRQSCTNKFARFVQNISEKSKDFQMQYITSITLLGQIENNFMWICLPIGVKMRNFSCGFPCLENTFMCFSLIWSFYRTFVEFSAGVRYLFKYCISSCVLS